MGNPSLDLELSTLKIVVLGNIYLGGPSSLTLFLGASLGSPLYESPTPNELVKSPNEGAVERHLFNKYSITQS